MPGAPLSIEVTGVIENSSADGTIEKWISLDRVYRDAVGRVRSESTVSSADSASDEPMLRCSITDPIAGFGFFVDTRSRIAYRRVLPKNFGRFGGGFFSNSELASEKGEKTEKIDDLGKQTIQGIEVQGTRRTVTMVHQPSRLATDEHWISSELGLMWVSLTLGPAGKMNSRIQNIIPKEPDPSLFMVPPDYSIQDLAVPRPPQ